MLESGEYSDIRRDSKCVCFAVTCNSLVVRTVVQETEWLGVMPYSAAIAANAFRLLLRFSMASARFEKRSAANTEDFMIL